MIEKRWRKKEKKTRERKTCVWESHLRSAGEGTRDLLNAVDQWSRKKTQHEIVNLWFFFAFLTLDQAKKMVSMVMATFSFAIISFLRDSTKSFWSVKSRPFFEKLISSPVLLTWALQYDAKWRRYRRYRRSARAVQGTLPSTQVLINIILLQIIEITL